MLCCPAVIRWIVAAATLAYFWWGAGGGLHAGFSGDDLMNLYLAWTKSGWELARDAALYFLPAQRPLGGLFYRVTFRLAGFDPLPFRITCLALLAGNLGILFGCARRLSGSAETAVLAALIFCYHARFSGLYCNTGTVYDILCFAFYFGALWVYVASDDLSRGRLAVFLALYIAALDSKEMAVTLPLVAAAYELLLRGKARRPGLVWSAALTVPYAVVRLLFPGPLAHHPQYTPVFSVARYFATWRTYTEYLFYAHGWFDAPRLVALWAILLGVAVLLRSRVLIFCWIFITVTPLPLAFIPPRAGFAYYIPAAGWALYLAVLLVKARDALRSAIQRAPAGAPARLALFALVLLLLARAHRVQRSWTYPCREERQQVVLGLTEALRAHPLRPASGSRFLFLGDSFPPGDYALEFFVRLYYGDRTLIADRQPQPAARYCAVLRYENGRWAVAD